MTPSQLTRRRLLGAMALAGVVPRAFGNAWPGRPIRLVSPYGAGGSNDTSARVLAEALSRKYGEQVVVENKPGAGTRVASDSVAHAAPDGYTLLWAAAPFAINTAAGLAQRFDIHKDFVAVGPRVLGPLFLIVNANSSVKTVGDFVKMAQGKPGGVTFASPGIGSGPHLTAELFASQARFKVLNVHYRGDATAYTELLAGRVDATLTAITTALPFIHAGKLRVIAVAADARTPVYPDALTFAEQGVPGVVGHGWFGIVAPARTPAAIVQQVNQDASRILGDAQVRQKLLDLGLQPVPDTSTEFAAFIDSEVKKWGALIKARGIVLE